MKLNKEKVCEISVSHGGKYED